MTLTEKKIKEKEDLTKKLAELENEYSFLNTQVEARTLEMKLLKTRISQVKHNINKL